MLKSRVSTFNQAKGEEPGEATQEAQTSTRDRLTRFTGTKDPVAPLETDQDMRSSDEQSRDAIAEQQAQNSYEAAAKAAQSMGSVGLHAETPAPTRGRKPLTDEQKAEAKARREATKPVKKATTDQTERTLTAADVRAAIKELEGTIKETKQRHTQELDALRAKYVELNSRLFAFMSA
jgi:hypothetical protein